MTYSGSLVQRQTVQGFIPNVWAGDIRYYRNKKFIGDLLVVRKDFIGKKGDTYTEPLVGRAAVFPKLGGQPVQLQARSPGGYEMKIDQYKESSYAIEDIASIQSQYELRKPYTREAGYALARDADNSILALRAAIPTTQQIFRTIGVGAGTAAGTPAPIDADSILAAKTFLEEADVPMDEIVIAVAPGQFNDMLNIDKFINADFVDGSPVVNGVIGSVYGMKVVSTTNITMNSLTGYRNGEGALGQPTPGVQGSPYLPTQDVIIGTGLPRGQTGNEITAPFVSCLVCNREWARFAMQKNITTEYSRENLLQADALVTTHVYGSKTYRIDHAILIHTAP